MPVTECRVHWHLVYTQQMFYHSQDGLTPLLAATQENHTEIVKLLDAGAADINIRETVLPIQVLIKSRPQAHSALSSCMATKRRHGNEAFVMATLWPEKNSTSAVCLLHECLPYNAQQFV